MKIMLNVSKTKWLRCLFNEQKYVIKLSWFEQLPDALLDDFIFFLAISYVHTLRNKWYLITFQSNIFLNTVLIPEKNILSNYMKITVTKFIWGNHEQWSKKYWSPKNALKRTIWLVIYLIKILWMQGCCNHFCIIVSLNIQLYSNILYV